MLSYGAIKGSSRTTGTAQPKISEADFLTALSKATGGNQRDIVVYAHGCCTPFQLAVDEGALVSGQITDLPVVSFSMPMRKGQIGYTADEDQELRSEPHFRAFLDLLLQHNVSRRIHIIAHSLGNRLVLGALRTFAFEHAKDGKRLGNIVLAAADADTEAFIEQIPDFPKVVGHVTVYRSNVDHAIEVSSGIHAETRLGALPQKTLFTGVPGVDSIDASAFYDCPGDMIIPNVHYLNTNHFYWKLSFFVRNDIAAALNGAAPNADPRNAHLQQMGNNEFAFTNIANSPDCKTTQTQIVVGRR